MTGARLLHLAASQPVAAPSKRRAPALRVIEGGGQDSFALAYAWRTSDTGRVLPRTHRLTRLRIDRYQATKLHRELADQLDAATDALEATDYSPEAVAAWDAIAAAMVQSPWAGSMAKNLRDLRHRIAFLAALAGEEFEHGCLIRNDGPHKTRAAAAFAVLDWIVYKLIGTCEAEGVG